MYKKSCCKLAIALLAATGLSACAQMSSTWVPDKPVVDATPVQQGATPVPQPALASVDKASYRISFNVYSTPDHQGPLRPVGGSIVAHPELLNGSIVTQAGLMVESAPTNQHPYVSSVTTTSTPWRLEPDGSIMPLAQPDVHTKTTRDMLYTGVQVAFKVTPDASGQDSIELDYDLTRRSMAGSDGGFDRVMTGHGIMKMPDINVRSYADKARLVLGEHKTFAVHDGLSMDVVVDRE